MMTLPYVQQLIDYDQQTTKAWEGLTDGIAWLINHNVTPKTANVMHAMVCGMDDLKEIILECADRRDLVGMSLIYRSMIERYLRLYYLFVRQYNDTNDELTQCYVDAQDMYELAACRWADHLSSPNNTGSPFSLNIIWERMIDGHVRFAQYTLPTAKKLLAEFAWEAILSFLETAKVRQERDDISDLIHDHARTLCYVQGGMLLDYFMRYFQQHDDQWYGELRRIGYNSLKLCLEAKQLCCGLFEEQYGAFSALIERLEDALGSIPTRRITS